MRHVCGDETCAGGAARSAHDSAIWTRDIAIWAPRATMQRGSSSRLTSRAGALTGRIDRLTATLRRPASWIGELDETLPALTARAMTCRIDAIT
jgi:hypothetical protein